VPQFRRQKAESRKQKAVLKSEGRKQKAAPQASSAFCFLPSDFRTAFCLLLRDNLRYKSGGAGVPQQSGDLGIAFCGGFQGGPPVLVSDARICAVGKQGPHDISAAL
jgi:hypothetical protein